MNAYGVSDLVVRYGDDVAVEGVSLTVASGEIVALVGGDGAGKTSVLRALAGARAPQGGTVQRPAGAQIGYVPADRSVYRDLTTRENLAFAGAAYGLRGSRLEQGIAAQLAATGLESAADRLAGDLSGGMRQKLALGCALLHQPRLLVLDEATTGVDPISRAALWRRIARAVADGTAVVFASTYLDEADRAGHVVVLAEGRMLLSGPPAAIIAGMPGRLTQAVERPAQGFAYRRGATFRVWDPTGDPSDAALAPDLQDAVTVAALAVERDRGRIAQ